MYVHGTAVAKIIEAPHLVQQLIAGVDAVGRGRQVVQQLQLLRRRVHLLAVHQQLIAVQIDLQLVEYQLFLGVVGDLAAAQHRVDAGHQLLHLEGLHQIVVGSHLQTGDAVAHVALGRQHDDGRLALFPDVGAHAPAVHDGQHDVQQHHVRRPLVVFLHGFAAVVGQPDLEALLLQIHADQLRYVAVILHHQNVACHGRLLLTVYSYLSLYRPTLIFPERFVNSPVIRCIVPHFTTFVQSPVRARW